MVNQNQLHQLFCIASSFSHGGGANFEIPQDKSNDTKPKLVSDISTWQPTSWKNPVLTPSHSGIAGYSQSVRGNAGKPI